MRTAGKAATIKLMDVQEFIEKFRNVFEPKPKPAQPTRRPSVLVISANPPLAPTAKPSAPSMVSPPQPSVAIRSPPASLESPADAITVHQTLPKIVLEKLFPTIQVPSEPSTPLGIVLVVLTSWQDGETSGGREAKSKPPSSSMNGQQMACRKPLTSWSDGRSWSRCKAALEPTTSSRANTGSDSSNILAR